MSKILILLALCFVLGCKSNHLIVNPPSPPPPINNRIDSISIDEEKGELMLTGRFDSSSAAQVIVDSVSLIKTFFSDSLIRANIPVSGKGSAGWVQVKIKDTLSNKKLLTYFHFEVYHNFWSHFGDAGYGESFNEDTIHVRADILSMAGKGNTQLSFSKLSHCHDIADGHNGLHGSIYGGPTYDTSGILHGTISYSASAKTFTYLISYYYMIDNAIVVDEADITLDVNYLVINKDVNPGQNCFDKDGNPHCFHWDSIMPTDFPPN
jgi:hypothetical protein